MSKLNDILGTEASGINTRIEENARRQVKWYATRAAAVSAANAIGVTWTAGATIGFDGLTFTYDGTSSIIPDMMGWSPSGLITTRHFGVSNTGDSTSSLQAAFDSRLPMIHDTFCYCNSIISTNGSVNICGIGKGLCGIIWPSTAASEGISISPASWDDRINISGIDLITGSSLAEGTGIYINWLPLGISGLQFFDRRAYIEKVRCIGQVRYTNGWKVGASFDFPFAVEVRDCEFWGKSTTSAVVQSDFVSGSVGINVPDQSTRTLANFGITNCICFCFETAAYIRNVEGFWAEGNDFQVCLDGLIVENTISQVNQYRVRFNHIGVSGRQASFKFCRQILLEGNEISYRYGRTDGAVISLIEIDTCSSFNIVGNSIRGNVTTDTDVVLSGISYLWTATTYASNYTRKGVVTGNSFQNLSNAEINYAGTNARYISRTGNAYENIRNDRLSIGSANATFTGTMFIGTGDFEAGDPSSTNVATVISNIGASCLSLDRQATDGMSLIMRRDGAIVGGITTTATGTTYNTTSDARLKESVSILSPSDAISLIKKIVVRNFRWLSTGEMEIGAFAQELYEVYPAAVTVGVGSPGDPDFVPWSIDAGKLVWLLIAAIQDER